MPHLGARLAGAKEGWRARPLSSSDGAAEAGLIMVRRDGRRFANEADAYHDVMSALFAATPLGEAAEAWLICVQASFGAGASDAFDPARFRSGPGSATAISSAGARSLSSRKSPE